MQVTSTQLNIKTKGDNSGELSLFFAGGVVKCIITNYVEELSNGKKK